MASKNKKKKAVNSYCDDTLKDGLKLKRTAFFNSATRQRLKRELRNSSEV